LLATIQREENKTGNIWGVYTGEKRTCAHTSQTSTDVTIVFLTRVFSREGTQKNYYTRMEENPPKQKWRSFSKKQCMEMNVKCVTHNHCKVTKEWFITST